MNSVATPCPFPGLRPFEFEDRAFFFGRDRQIEELYQKLLANRFLAVVGSSGSGKSSLVKAGLFGNLHDRAKQELGLPWITITLRPQSAPLRELAKAVADRQAIANAASAMAQRSLYADRARSMLTRSSLGLVELLGEIDRKDSVRILIVVDQFEEIFRSGRASEEFNERDLFVKHLLAASQADDLPYHVLLTMRSEFLGDCTQFLDLPEAISNSQFLTPRLTREQRAETIAKPLSAVGCGIAPALLQRLLNDCGSELDQLPVLQHALMRTWHFARGAPELRMSHYESAGTMERALSDHAEQILQDMRPNIRAATERAFRALSEQDTMYRSVRRPIIFETLVGESGANELELRAAIDSFRSQDCAFILPVFSKPLEVSTLVDISHEALLRKWPRLIKWIEEEANDKQTYVRLVHEINDPDGMKPERAKRSYDWLTALAPTQQWAERYGGRLDEVRQLIDLSIRVTAARDDAAGLEAVSREAINRRLEAGALDLRSADGLSTPARIPPSPPLSSSLTQLPLDSSDTATDPELQLSLDELTTALRERPIVAERRRSALERINAFLADPSVTIGKQQMREMLLELRFARQFDDMTVLADRLATRDSRNLSVVAFPYAQGLIDSGRVLAGIELLNAAIANQKLTPGEHNEAIGILARAHKMIYVTYVNLSHDSQSIARYSHHLKFAIENYGRAFDPDNPSQNHWDGVNYIALLRRAQRDGVRVVSKGDPDEMAHGIIAALESRTPSFGDHWLEASLGEFYLAVGDYDRAAEHMARFATHPRVDAYILSGTVRQLEEVWQISASKSGAGAILTGLKAALAAHDGGGVRLTAGERSALFSGGGSEFQEQFEASGFIKFTTLKRIVECSLAVAAIQSQSLRQTMGGGFLVRGPDFSEHLSDERSYVLTAAHMLWDPELGSFHGVESPGVIRPEHARIIFEDDLLSGSEHENEASRALPAVERNRAYRCARVVWQSPPSLHDATLIELDRKVQNIQPLALAPREAMLIFGDGAAGSDKGTRLAVLGYPEGGNLAVSVQRRIDEARASLVDIGRRSLNGAVTDPIYLHYRTPTGPGTSGSPVFEAENWQVVAIHHAGFTESAGLPKLGGKPGVSFANEGIWIHSIIDAVRAHLDGPKRERRRSWFR